MNVEATKNFKKTESVQKTQQSSKPIKEDDKKFAEELKGLKKDSEKESALEDVEKTGASKDKQCSQEKVNDKQAADEQKDGIDADENADNSSTEKLLKGHAYDRNESSPDGNDKTESIRNGKFSKAGFVPNEQNQKETSEKEMKLFAKENSEDIEGAIDGLKDVFNEFNKLKEVSNKEFVDNEKNENEEAELIDNNMNIQDPLDKINLQMGSNMNFSGNGQPFSDFVAPEKAKASLAINAKDLEEEKSILSTMDENIAIANKNLAMSKVKTVETEEGIKKVDRKTNVTVETVVSYDKVVMDKADVDFFVNLVENGEVDMNSVQNASKSSAVSKTLADLIAKSMQDNKPIRIDFDNDISVIIKVSRDGKISADFLPSSQVAEAYLKENLPLLRQRFDDNNIEYEELNQRKQKQNDQENRKKGRKDE